MLANVVRLYRGEDLESADGSTDLMAANFPDGTYADVPGLCKVATVAENEADVLRAKVDAAVTGILGP